MEQAVLASDFTERTVKRWLERHREGGVDALQVRRTSRPGRRRKELSPSVQGRIDGLLQRLPHLRTRSMQDYLRRHHQVKVSRRALQRYLEERGFVDESPVGKQTELRRFEAAAPLDLVQVDILWVGGNVEERLFVVNVL